MVHHVRSSPVAGKFPLAVWQLPELYVMNISNNHLEELTGEDSEKAVLPAGSLHAMGKMGSYFPGTSCSLVGTPSPSLLLTQSA